MSKYAWVITEDSFLAEATTAAIRAGPAGPDERPAVSEVITQGRLFRMLDESGQELIRGYIMGEYDGLEPLEDYGRQFGCTGIEYEQDGNWISPK